MVQGVTVPGASTPSFYLVSSSQATAANLFPLRTTGGAGGYATLSPSGLGPIGVFYFVNGVLTAAPASSTSSTQKALIGPVLGSTGCSIYGSLGFTTTSGSSSNKCALYNPFTIQSNQENSQMGAQLVFNGTTGGGFYACGSGLDVWYQPSPSSGPPGLACTPISLWTVTVE